MVSMPPRVFRFATGCRRAIDKRGMVHYELNFSRLLGCPAFVIRKTVSPATIKIRATVNMPRTKKKTTGRTTKDRTQNFFDDANHDEVDEQDLPSDEAGRHRIKKNYEELLGIRIEKLKGRVLNREKINKSIDGIYFICVACKKVCHNLDEGLVEDPNTQTNYCSACAKEKGVRGNAA